MNKKMIFFRALTAVFSFSYLLNFFWESLHTVYLYEGHNILSEEYLKMMLYTSFIDAILISLIFAIGSLLWRTTYWLSDYDSKKELFTIILGIVFAAIIEIKALYFNQWSYNEMMPLVFGIGLSPLVQLGITGVITFYFVSKITR